MYGMVKQDRFELSRTSVTVGCGVALLDAVILHYVRAAQKWGAALVGTLAPFWYLASVFQSKWASASFWMSLAISLMAHPIHLVCLCRDPAAREQVEPSETGTQISTIGSPALSSLRDTA